MLPTLKNSTQHSVLDYGLLMSCLQRYKAPHRKITTLLQSGEIVRVKKGLYILGKQYRDEPINKALLANLIFGPSYVSQEYALQYYGLIPERVEMVTSMTTKRNKLFDTPLGHFRYCYLNPRRFTVGVDPVNIGGNTSVLFASPEKAIADTVAQYRKLGTINDMATHLIDNMRMDEHELMHLNMERLAKINHAYRNRSVSLFYRTLKRGF